MRYILSLDTCFKNWSITISNDSGIINTKNLISKNDVSSILINEIDNILKESGINLEDIDLFSITNGPGLFTGIRIGLSAVKGLNFIFNKPIIPVSTLEVIGFIANEKQLPVVSLIDARRDELYLGVYDFSKDLPRVILEPVLVNVSQVYELLRDYYPFVISGYGIENYENNLRDLFSDTDIKNFNGFLSEALAKISIQYYKHNKYLNNIKNLLPFYIRKPDAELKRTWDLFFRCYNMEVKND